MKNIIYLNTDISIFIQKLQKINEEEHINSYYPEKIGIEKVFDFQHIFRFLPTDYVESIASRYLESTDRYKKESKIKSNKFRISTTPDFHTYYKSKGLYIEFTPALLNFLFLFVVDTNEDADKKLQILLHFIQNFKDERLSLLMMHKVFGIFIQRIQDINKLLQINNSGYIYNLNKIAEHCQKYDTYDESSHDIVQLIGLGKEKEKESLINDFQHILNEILSEKILYDSAKYIHLEAKKFLQNSNSTRQENISIHKKFDSAYYTSFITTLAIAKIWSTDIDTTIKVECSALIDNFIKNLYVLVDDTISPMHNRNGLDDYINYFSRKESYAKIATNKGKARQDYFHMLEFFEFTSSSLYSNEVKITKEQINTTIEDFKNIRNNKQTIKLELDPNSCRYIPKLLDFILYCSFYFKEENIQTMLKSDIKSPSKYQYLNKIIPFDIKDLSEFEKKKNKVKVKKEDKDKEQVEKVEKVETEEEKEERQERNIKKAKKQKIYQYSYLLIITFFKTKYPNNKTTDEDSKKTDKNNKITDENVNFLKNMMLHITRTSKISVNKYNTSTVKPVYFFQYLSNINNN